MLTKKTHAPGIVANLDRVQYDEAEGCHWSTLKHLAKSPALYKHLIEHPPEDKDAFRKGRAVHCATLEPQKFASEFAIWTDGIRRGKAWDAFEVVNADKTILTEKELHDVRDISRAVLNNPLASSRIAKGDAEVSMFWEHEVIKGLSLPCKGRADFISDSCIVDLKTTRDASPDGFAREVVKHSYAGQAAFYSDGYAKITGKRLPFIFIAVELEAPHIVTVFRIPDSVIAVGRAMYEGCLSTLALSNHENHWPGYADKEVELVLPKWVTANAESLEVA